MWKDLSNDFYVALQTFAFVCFYAVCANFEKNENK